MEEPLSMLLDIIEVAKLHTGENLTTAFAKIFEDFGHLKRYDINF